MSIENPNTTALEEFSQRRRQFYQDRRRYMRTALLCLVGTLAMAVASAMCLTAGNTITGWVAIGIGVGFFAISHWLMTVYSKKYDDYASYVRTWEKNLRFGERYGEHYGRKE